jgi:hypothetical protein
LTKHRFKTFCQDGFVAIKKNSRHILYLSSQPPAKLATVILGELSLNNSRLLYVFICILQSFTSVVNNILPKMRINSREYPSNFRALGVFSNTFDGV